MIRDNAKVIINNFMEKYVYNIAILDISKDDESIDDQHLGNQSDRGMTSLRN